MPFDLYHILVPTAIRGLENLDVILKKGEAYAAENGIDPQKFAEAKIHIDMKDLIFQGRLACDSAKLAAVRVGGVPNEPMEDNEKTLEDIHARIAKTINYLKNVDKSAFDDKTPDSEFTMTQGGQDLTFTRQAYLFNFAFPNFFFHVTTAYDILRAQGVPLGKIDYLAGRDGSTPDAFKTKKQ